MVPINQRTEVRELIENVEILTIKQRTAWELRKTGITFKQIALQMGITPSAASELVHKAERRFRDYERYQNAKERNNEVLQISLTRGECKLLVDAISEYERVLMRSKHVSTARDLYGDLPYENLLLPLLYEKLQILVYGRVITPGFIQNE